MPCTEFPVLFSAACWWPLFMYFSSKLDLTINHTDARESQQTIICGESILLNTLGREYQGWNVTDFNGVATSIKSITFLLLNLRKILLVFLTEMNADATQVNWIACHKESNILIYCVVSSLLDAAQSKITLLDARTDEFCSNAWADCSGRYVLMYPSDL